jgi:hypothetical protein
MRGLAKKKFVLPQALLSIPSPYPFCPCKSPTRSLIGEVLLKAMTTQFSTWTQTMCTRTAAPTLFAPGQARLSPLLSFYTEKAEGQR